MGFIIVKRVQSYNYPYGSESVSLWPSDCHHTYHIDHVFSFLQCLPAMVFAGSRGTLLQSGPFHHDVYMVDIDSKEFHTSNVYYRICTSSMAAC